MECVVANVEHMRFDIEIALDEQYGALPLPFTGMDSTSFYTFLFLYSELYWLSLRTAYYHIYYCAFISVYNNIQYTVWFFLAILN